MQYRTGSKFVLIASAGVALIAGAAQAQYAAQASPKPVATSAIPVTALKSRAEETYQQVRDALGAKDYDAFMRLTLPAGKGKPPPKAAFEQIALTLQDDYPVLESLNFVKLERSGDWIGYYAEDRVSDPKRTTIFFFRFKRIGDELKMSGRIVVKDVPRSQGQIGTLDEISLNPKFRLPGQKGYKE